MTNTRAAGDLERMAIEFAAAAEAMGATYGGDDFPKVRESQERFWRARCALFGAATEYVRALSSGNAVDPDSRNER